MSPPVFAHGNLRLYLLSLLAERPYHGYEIIQALSDRFGGTYSPSAGTIYPRLAKLEEEGLVTKRSDGRKSVYRITRKGRAELAARGPELDEIEKELTDSVRRLADEVRAEVGEAMRTLRADLASAAREARRTARKTSATQPTRRNADDNPDTSRVFHEADLALNEFRQQLRMDLRLGSGSGALDAETVDFLRQALDRVRSEIHARLKPSN